MTNYRIAIIGNTGSGKTTLAQALSSTLSYPILSLDNIVWTCNQFTQKHTPQNITQAVTNFLVFENWIIEGVYGDLIHQTLKTATHLIWLDLPWNICKKNISDRHFTLQSTSDLSLILSWGEEYETRDYETSKKYHETLFQEFTKAKIRVPCHLRIDESLLTTLFGNSNKTNQEVSEVY
jgi:adenylate kinase family enzyme